MTSRDFAFWLQGYFEISRAIKPSLNDEQCEVIIKHLALVFKHEIDPSMGDKEHQVTLNKIHNKSVIGWPGKDEDGNQMRC